MDYSSLRDLLKDGKWREAEDETRELLIQAAGEPRLWAGFECAVVGSAAGFGCFPSGVSVTGGRQPLAQAAAELGADPGLAQLWGAVRHGWLVQLWAWPPGTSNPALPPAARLNVKRNLPLIVQLVHHLSAV